MDSAGAGFIFIAILLGIYLLPGIIASIRHHPQQLPIWLLTVLLGWTFVGWVVALVWSFMTSSNSTPVVFRNEYSPQAAKPITTNDPTLVADEIERFGKLKESGFITEEEFETKKQQLLGNDRYSTLRNAKIEETPVQNAGSAQQNNC